MTKILSAILCLVLLIPTLESMVLEFGLINTDELIMVDFSENESENKETEKEEKKEKESEEFDLMVSDAFKGQLEASGWIENSYSYRSWVREIPSPPPDFQV